VLFAINVGILRGESAEQMNQLRIAAAME